MAGASGQIPLTLANVPTVFAEHELESSAVVKPLPATEPTDLKVP